MAIALIFPFHSFYVSVLELLFKRLNYKVLLWENPNQIELLSAGDVLLFPGGSVDFQTEWLESNNLQIFIRDLIYHNGINYIGICAGSRLAVDYLKLVDIGIIDTDIDLSSDVEITFTPECKIYSNENSKMTFSNSTLFNQPNTNDVQVLCKYKDNEACECINGAPAIVYGLYGKGKVLLFSSHPESNASTFNIVEGLVRNYIISTCPNITFYTHSDCVEQGLLFSSAPKKKLCSEPNCNTKSYISYILQDDKLVPFYSCPNHKKEKGMVRFKSIQNKSFVQESTKNECAVLAFGSLIWNKGTLATTDFNPDGPILPIQFSRISKDGRATLVVDFEYGKDVQSWYATSLLPDLKSAILNLYKRESSKRSFISTINLENQTFYISEEINGTFEYMDDEIILSIESIESMYIVNIIKWAESKAYKYVIWTGIPPNFSEIFGKDWSPESLYDYLYSLSGPTKIKAKEYIANVPTNVFQTLNGSELVKAFD